MSTMLGNDNDALAGAAGAVDGVFAAVGDAVPDDEHGVGKGDHFIVAHQRCAATVEVVVRADDDLAQPSGVRVALGEGVDAACAAADDGVGIERDIGGKVEMLDAARARDQKLHGNLRFSVGGWQGIVV